MKIKLYVGRNKIFDMWTDNDSSVPNVGEIVQIKEERFLVESKEWFTSDKYSAWDGNHIHEVKLYGRFVKE